MKLVNASSGKVGHYLPGPKFYLNESIRLGEVAICISRDPQQASKPFIWLVGGVEQLIDYVSLAKSKGTLDNTTSDLVLGRLDEAKKKLPKTAYERLASALGIEESELKEMIEISQVSVTAPIGGVQDFSEKTPKWLQKTPSYAPIH